MVRLLEAHDVSHIFGLCGDTTLPFYDAMFRLDHTITHVLTRDERHAGYMADAYARLTGKVGVCEGPSGGGATYIVPGVVEANESSVPVLAITSDVSTTSRGRYPLTELDQCGLFKPLVKRTRMLDEATRLPAQVRAAFTAMTSDTPGAAHLGFPFDSQKAPVEPGEIYASANAGHFPATRLLADHERISTAVDMLAASKRAIIICGGGVVLSGAQDSLLSFARLFSTPVATTISGQGSVAETDPLALGVVGSNGGTPETRKVVEEADLVFLIGCRAGSVTTERWRVPKPDTPIIHLDTDSNVIGANYQTQVGLVGDARVCLDAMVELSRNLNNRPDHDGVARVGRAVKEKFRRLHELAASTQKPVRPERVIVSLQDILPPDAIVCADPGTPCPYFSAYYRWPKAGRHFITNRAHGALGYALAAAIGAAFARPDAKVVAAMGDGSFAFCCGEFETIMRYNLPITTIVFSNSVFGWIKAGQNAGFAKRFYNVDFNRTDHAKVAQAYGLKSWRVQDPETLHDILAQAVAHDGPSLVDIICQPLHEAAAPVGEWVA